MKKNVPVTPVKDKKKVYKTPSFRAYASVKSQLSTVRAQMMDMMASGGMMM